MSGLEQLANTLSTINPSLQKYIGTRMEQAAKEEQAKGTQIAIEKAVDGFKDVTKSIKQTEGTKAARQLIGGSIFADRAYQRTKAEILGNSLETTLFNSYGTTRINGKSLNTYKFESPEFQGWLQTEREKVVGLLDDVNPTYLNEKFLPKLAEATGAVTTSHIEQHNEYKLESLKSLAVPLVKGIINSKPEKDSELITNFELSMNELGLVSEDRKDINDTLVKVIIDQAEAVGLSGNGDVEGAEDILEIAKLFPYGPNGSLNLIAHPDYQNKVNKLKKSIGDFAFTQERRREIEKKREETDDIVNTLKRFAETGDAALITDLQTRRPLEASKIGTAAVALDGNTRDRSAQIESRIIEGGYASKKDAAIAAYNWYNDDRTPKTQANRSRLSQLLTVANSSESGDYTEVNKGLSELNTQLKGEFSGSDFIISDTGQLNDLGSKEVTDLYNAAKLELYRYILGPEGREADTLTVIEKIEEIKGKYINKARKKVNPSSTEINKVNPNQFDNRKNTPDSQDLSDLKGDAAFASEDDNTPTTVTVEQGDTLTKLADSFSTTVEAIMKANNITNPDVIRAGQELIMPIVNTIGNALVPESDLTNKSVLDEIDITQPFTYNSLYRLALEVGFPPEDAKTAAAIALAESSGRAAIDTVQSGLDPNKENEFSLGLWQIDMQDTPGYMVGKERRPQFGIESNQELYNPLTNAKAAKILYDRAGGKFTDWATFNDGKYKKFLPKN
tara:strand:- start:43 stop:2241 length:2199 start_codon:yes stop_codon:yes gene_type:complete